MTRIETPAEVADAVSARYSAGATAVEMELCCPVDYDPRYLGVIPAEVLERDYGCGDPSRHLVAGETVLDLGSGGGKICFIASQVVGPCGRVIGIDVNDEMLSLARGAAPRVADAVGFANVEFRKGHIQDLALDVDRLGSWLADHPVTDVVSLAAMDAEVSRQRREEPLVADGSIDVVVSNCVLNLVATEHKAALFGEIFRVLRRGGRAVISDIVSDHPVPDHLRQDPELWSGCVSGAYQEDDFLRAFTDAGFYGITLETRASDPWRVVEGIEFRSVTVVAFKGKQGECWDHGQAVIYRGPWRAVEDDDDHVFQRGVPTAVCAKSFDIYARAPYAGSFELLGPAHPVDPETAPPFDCGHSPEVATSPATMVRRDVGGLVSTCDPGAGTGCC
jgi:arsenite methyltransferase